MNIHEIIQSFSENDAKISIQALEFATKAHETQIRKSGQPYIIHPIAVAEQSWKYYKDKDLFLACLLHDTVEDNEEIEMCEIYEQFGDTVGFLVDAVTKTKYEYEKDKSFIPVSTIEKLLYGGLKDIRVLLLKILDREHNLQTLNIFRPEKQMRISFETQAIYTPLSFLFSQEGLNIVQKKFNAFLEKNSIEEVYSFKKCLYNKSFLGCEDKDFPILYKNSDKVIWRFEDKDLYITLCETNERFCKNHELVKMQESEAGHFFVEIQFTNAFGWNGGQCAVARCKSY